MVLTVTLNPCVDKSILIDRLKPGEFNNALSAHDVAGGKGTNAARMLHTLGVPVKSLVMLGGSSGRRVEELIRERDGIEPIVVWTRASTRMIVTVREEGPGVNTALVEPSPEVTEDEVEALRRAYEHAIEDVQIVTFGGSAPCEILEPAYAEMIDLAKAKGILTILDSRDGALRLGVARVPYMVKPNVVETERLLGRALSTEDDLWEAIDWYRCLGIEAVVLSRGREGGLVSWGGDMWRTRSPVVRTVNPVGSGDCLVAGIASGILRGWEHERCVRLGIACGAANAAVWDAAGATKEQVEALLGRVVLERR